LTDEVKRRHQIIAGVSYDTDLDHAVSVIRKSVEGIDGIDSKKGIDIFASEFNSSSVDFTVRWWAGSMDSMFTELARRTANNMGEYIDAAERYGRLALKAQSNSRATLEALAKLHQPREQTVRHVHVNEGGQAVVADHFHNHTGGNENVETVKQPHATRAAGEGPALPSSDPLREGVPITSDKGQETVQDARRK
jgi:hypothetical protein